jgi:hypothetical protein
MTHGAIGLLYDCILLLVAIVVNYLVREHMVL